MESLPKIKWDEIERAINFLLREQDRFTGRAIGKAVGVSGQAISLLKTRKRTLETVSYKTIKKLYDFCEKNFDQFS